MEPDREAGRRHALVVHGTGRAAPLYRVLLAAGFGALVLGVLAGILPVTALLALLGLPAALLVMRALRRHHRDPERLLPAMGMNVALTLVTPVLLATGIAWG